ncbi:MAG: hypothetical protein IPH51_12705 [Rubrivivax sp.]|nr:hypothetical protein [Rubrivivax sp.]
MCSRRNSARAPGRSGRAAHTAAIGTHPDPTGRSKRTDQRAAGPSDRDRELLLGADDIVYDDASPVKASNRAQGRSRSEFLYTPRLTRGEQVMAHLSSHHDHQVGEWIGIRARSPPRGGLSAHRHLKTRPAGVEAPDRGMQLSLPAHLSGVRGPILGLMYLQKFCRRPSSLGVPN